MAPRKVTDPSLLDARDTDIVIPIMGATGAGKSTFINQYLKAIGHPTRVAVGDQLLSCTVIIESIVVEGQIGSRFPHLPSDSRVVIVDTPGFDDITTSDFEILKRIAYWLQESYRKNMIIGGVIYLYDISHHRFSGAARKNIELFNRLCGDAALSKVVLATSNWDKAQGRDLEMREEELKHVHWEKMIRGGAAVMRLEAGSEGQSAVNVVNYVLKNEDRRAGARLRREVLQIQDELVSRKKFLADTQAGRELKEQLQQVIEAQTEMLALEQRRLGGDPEAEREAQEKRRRLADQVQKLKTFWRKHVFRRVTNVVEGDGAASHQLIQTKMEPGDIVLLITGASGAGRSTFINALLRDAGGEKMKIGESLTPCTTEVHCSMIDLRRTSHFKKEYRLFVLDTPGFNNHDARKPNSVVLQGILDWLHDWIRPSTTCRAGVVYLQDISGDRLPDLAKINFAALSNHFDQGILKQLAFVTTKGKFARNAQDGHSHIEGGLGHLIAKGSGIYRFHDDQDDEGAWSILKGFLPSIEAGKEVGVRGVRNGISLKSLLQLAARIAVPVI